MMLVDRCARQLEASQRSLVLVGSTEYPRKKEPRIFWRADGMSRLVDLALLVWQLQPHNTEQLANRRWNVKVTASVGSEQRGRKPCECACVGVRPSKEPAMVGEMRRSRRERISDCLVSLSLRADRIQAREVWLALAVSRPQREL